VIFQDRELYLDLVVELLEDHQEPFAEVEVVVA
jgi:hypothetical protein